ncbi:hypothetical protein [Tomitella gaofuii]|uniref:hypothetical protein n=2 Tax=Tomitella gaofuii TaxID=2760083 RepID=UPI0020C0CFA5|nr:hypothetical protein [Tomitella gaofuii]
MSSQRDVLLAASVTLAAAVALAGCAPTVEPAGSAATGESVAADGASAPDPLCTVTGALARLPAPDTRDNGYLTTGDLDAATAAAGTQRPERSDPAAVSAWLEAIGATGSGGTADEGRVVSVLTPAVFSVPAGQQAAVADEIGVGIADVGCFAADAANQSRFAVVSASVGKPIDLAAAVDAAAGEQMNGMWTFGSGEDEVTDLSRSTAARWNGAPLHMAMLGQDLAVSTSAEALNALVNGDVATAVDDTGRAAVASALDARHVYSAMLPDRTSGDACSMPAAFDAVGVGLSHSSGAPRLIVAYHQASAADAQRNADAVADVLAADPQLAGRLELVSADVEDTVTTAAFRLTGMPAASVWALPMKGASIVTHAGSPGFVRTK